MRFSRFARVRPTTVTVYRTLLATRILPFFGEMPLCEVTLSDIKTWRASLEQSTEVTNAGDFVICADEKTSIQARCRCHPSPPRPAPPRQQANPA